MNTKIIFKKILIGIIVVMTALSLLSCEKNTESDTTSTTNVTEKSDSVFVYNLYGVAEYIYNDNGKLVEIITLDPTTLSKSVANGDKFDCKYTYDENGYISELIYFGRKFTVDSTDGNNRPLSAACTEGGADLLVKFSYNSMGGVASERFYENNALVMVSTFDENGIPTSLEYTGTGKLSYTYHGIETNITMTYANSSEQAPDMTLYLNEFGLPNYLMQSADGAVKGTTWTYDENMLCIDTMIESIYEGQTYREEYEIYRNADGSIASIDYYVPGQQKEPLLYSRHFYEYTNANDFIIIDELYNKDDVVDEIVTYEYIGLINVKTVTETYSEGKLSGISIEDREYDDRNREKRVTTTKYDGNNALTSKSLTEFTFDNNTLIKKFTKNYDEKNVLSNTFLEIYSYNESGLVSRVEYIANDANNALIEKELLEFEYNKRGDVTLQIETMYDKTGTVILSTKTQNIYDENGELEDSIITSYDKDGNVVE